MTSFENQVQEFYEPEQTSETSCLSGACFSQEAIAAIKQENVNLQYENSVLQKRIEAVESGQILPVPTCFAGLEAGMAGVSSPDDTEEGSCFAAVGLPFEYMSVKWKNNQLQSEKRELEDRLQYLQQQNCVITNCASGCTDCMSGLFSGVGDAFNSSNSAQEEPAPVYEEPVVYEEPIPEDGEPEGKGNFSFATIFNTKGQEEVESSKGLIGDIFGTSKKEGSSGSLFNGFHTEIEPEVKTDVCYWLNFEAKQRGLQNLCCLNTAIEATSLNGRSCCSLLEQDEFIRDHITASDYLIVSVGGNDIALTPLLCTVLNLLVLSWCVPVACLENCACACPINTHVDGGCFTCGLEGCLCGSLCGWPPGVGYFVDLFKNRVQNYVARLVSKDKPKKIIVCMIYYLDEATTGSWADGTLGCMCYNSCPYRLQSAISTIFHLASKRISIPGTEVVAYPLFKVLDGKMSSDYIQRVEPSPSGGRKMATGLMDAILGMSLESSSGDSSSGEGAAAAPLAAPVSASMYGAGG